MLRSSILILSKPFEDVAAPHPCYFPHFFLIGEFVLDSKVSLFDADVR
jgi:hypothetical protein